MNITIIGAGNMGRGIGTRAAAGGHSVTFVDANPETAQGTALEVGKAARNGAKVSVGSFSQADLGEVVVLALWYGANLDTVKELGSKLAGKVVVDIANPLNSTFDELVTAPDSSSAEDVARAAASGVKVVKAFNTTFAGTLLAGSVAGQPLDVLIAGDDQAVLVPVPLHRSRLWRRGFNQSALVARELARHLKLRADLMLLRRIRRTPPLKGMTPLQRRKTVAGAFRVRDRGTVTGRTIILADDVLTTGSTAEACARALTRAGAARVELVSWARVVKPSQLMR